MSNMQSSNTAGLVKDVDLVTLIMQWEGGEMDEEQEADFFQGLIDSGTVNHLQGCYGRRARALIEAGVCHAPTNS